MSVWPDNLLNFVEIESKCDNRDEQIHGIVLSMTDLSAQEWRVTLLKFTCGYSEELIADKIGVVKKTVFAILKRVKQRLSEKPACFLLRYGYREGMKHAKQTFSGWESEPRNLPIQRACFEPALTATVMKEHLNLKKLDCMTDKEILKIHGVGCKYLKEIRGRLQDLKECNNPVLIYTSEVTVLSEEAKSISEEAKSLPRVRIVVPSIKERTNETV